MKTILKIALATFVALSTIFSAQATEEVSFVVNAPMVTSVGEAFRVEFELNAKVNLDDLFAQISEGAKELSIIVKADVGGSAEAVRVLRKWC